MTENGEYPFYEFVFLSVKTDVLIVEEFNDGLGHGHTIGLIHLIRFSF